MSTLHERITAKLNDLEVLARAVRNERFVLNAARQSGRTAFAAYLHDCGPEATLRGLAEDRDMLDLADRLTGDANEAFNEGSVEALTLLATARHLERSLCRRHGFDPDEEAS